MCRDFEALPWKGQNALQCHCCNSNSCDRDLQISAQDAVCWEIQSSYRYRLEGISSKMFGPRGPYDSLEEQGKSFVPVIFFPIKCFGDQVLAREFLFPGLDAEIYCGGQALAIVADGRDTKFRRLFSG